MSLAVVLTTAACLVYAAAALEGLAAWAARGRRLPQGERAVDPVSARWAADRTDDAGAEQLLDAAWRASGVRSLAVLRARERVAALVAAAWCAALILPTAGSAVAAIVTLPAAFAGRRVPRLLLGHRARTRASALREEAPDVIALVACAAGAGLPLAHLLGLVGEWLDGELAAGLGQAAHDLERGAAPAQVLAALERDYPIDDVAALTAILERGRLHGVAAGPALRALATNARASRARRAGERAARAAPRIQLVAALLLVPAALCILAAAMLSGGLG
jgi:tight adherence protein C